jgi:hypothetical protein
MPKLYLSKTGSGYTPATIRGTWDKTSDHVVRGMHTAQDLPGLGAPIAVSSVETSATTDYENLLLRGVSAPLAADHNFAGTLNLMLGAQESATDADMAYFIHVFITQGDTDNLRGTLLANYADPITNEWSTTAVGRALSSTRSLSAVSALAEDRIVVEIGYRARNTVSSSRTGTLWHGGNGADLTAGGNPASGVGFLDFSDAFTLVNNPTARLSQLVVESLRRPTAPNALVTQMPVEVVRRPTAANLRLSQMAVEVIRRNGTPQASGSQGGMLIIVAG